MKVPFFLLIAGLFSVLHSGDAKAQATPVFTAPTNQVGAALAEGVTQTLLRRGFAMNDPRIAQTATAIGARLASQAATVGSGASWITMGARLLPWATGAVLIYEGLNWYFTSDGKVSTADPASGGAGTTYQAYWWSVNLDGKWFRTPEEAAAYNYFSNYGWTTSAQGFSTSIGNLNGSVVSDVSFYVCTSSGCGATPRTARAYAGTPANSTCASGQGVSNSGVCFATNLNSSNFNLSVPKTDLQTAYGNLSSSAKSAPLSQPLAAELANRFWRDAASQPDYVGVPWSSANPVNSADFSPYRASYPAHWPVTSQLGSAVPTASPIVSPEVNPNAIPTAPAGVAKVDLGIDPGTPAPVLGDPPSDLFKPLRDMMSPWLNWAVPSHASECPTWSASPAIAGYVFNIDLSSHCSYAEQYRAVILSASIACWAILAAFIVLSA